MVLIKEVVTIETESSGGEKAQKVAKKGQATYGVDRVDVPKIYSKGKPLHGQQAYVHLEGKKKVAINQDGTYKHGTPGTGLTNAITEWLQGHGWNLK